MSPDPTSNVSHLVVLCHLRWNFVWQRPQHLISRFARSRRTWFVEEPLVADVSHPALRTADEGLVTRVWLEVPGPERHVDFDDRAAAVYRHELQALLYGSEHPLVWLSTPLALPLAQALAPGVLVYDVMDDLAAFRGARASALRFRQRQALERADLVFAGGRSLYAGVRHQRPDAHLFASGVEREHFQVARTGRAGRARPVAGYVGVIDERLDLALLADLARRLSDWEIRLVGPVAKIDVSSLPRADNIVYAGQEPYERLPIVLSELDVALMPFALNEATRSISPTKTLEYFASGLPVVSTRVPDVVADHGASVHFADGGAGFAQACRLVLDEPTEERGRRLEPVLRLHHWDRIAARMQALVEQAEPRSTLRTNVEASIAG